MNEYPEKKLGLGIIAGVSTGVFWGIPFLVPQILSSYTALEIAFGRFFFFGLLSFFFIGRIFRILNNLSTKERFRLLALSASGFWFYSILLFWGVHETSGIVSSLIIGLLPICIPLFAPERKGGGLRFYGGLFLLLLGLLNLFVYPTINQVPNHSAVRVPSLIGVAALLTCLVLWTWFAIHNAKFLKRNAEISRKDFASVIGVVSLISILPVFLIQVDFTALTHRPDFSTYLIWSMALGFGASWIANWLWNICSYHCPSEIAGPLIVSETVFGLLYTFLFERRLPHEFELASIFLFLIGVFFAVSAQMKSKRP